MSQQPNVVYVQRPSNSMGMAGFIISLVGWLSCGILCPVGLVLSIIGLRKDPRGFALAGVILGALGSVWAIVAFFFGGIALVIACGGAACAGIAPKIVTQVHLEATAREVEQFEESNGRLPTSLDEVTGQSRRSTRDGWDRPLRLTISGTGGFTISSDGPDGIPGNGDDIERYHSKAEHTATPKP